MLKLVASPGRSIDEVLKHSTAHVSHTAHAGVLMASVVGPHEVDVDLAHGRFQLPPGKFSALTGAGEKVTELLATPHLEHLSWRTWHPLAAAIHATVEAQGFRLATAATDAELRETLATQDQARVSAHGRSTVLVELRLKVAIRAGSLLARSAKRDGDGLLLSVVVSDTRSS